ncbi:hypothetical protein [Streptomyces sp. NPDC005573]|uniref:hypothetical protein n=1 Tax=Streptomyces sp. NPDC005573 TaxID=3156890 RepID=UPI0033AE8185
MLLSELVDAMFEVGALGGRLLDGLAGDHVVEVAELAHKFADPLALGEDLFLGASQLGLGVQGSLPSGRLDLVVLFLSESVMPAAAVGD